MSDEPKNPYSQERQGPRHAAWTQGYLEGVENSEILELRQDLEGTQDLLHQVCCEFPGVQRWLYGDD